MMYEAIARATKISEADFGTIHSPVECTSQIANRQSQIAPAVSTVEPNLQTFALRHFRPHPLATLSHGGPVPELRRASGRFNPPALPVARNPTRRRVFTADDADGTDERSARCLLRLRPFAV
jgi:hypothetical protein